MRIFRKLLLPAVISTIAAGAAFAGDADFTLLNRKTGDVSADTE
jgi:hypothetical protein